MGENKYKICILNIPVYKKDPVLFVEEKNSLNKKTTKRREFMVKMMNEHWMRWLIELVIALPFSRLKLHHCREWLVDVDVDVDVFPVRNCISNRLFSFFVLSVEKYFMHSNKVELKRTKHNKMIWLRERKNWFYGLLLLLTNIFIMGMSIHRNCMLKQIE